jgi:hypothetical protein
MIASLIFLPSSALLLFLFVALCMGTYLVWNYPKANAKSVTMRISADSVLAVLYMVVYMRSSPNLEAALRFAAETLTGPLSWDLKKLLWDIHVGVYPNADAALSAYANRWKKENEEFAEAVNLLRSSASVEASRRNKLFDETVNLILTGTAEKTKRYVSDLRMPVMLIHALGVLLPVMGLVLFPIVVIFMSDTVSPSILFLGYDVILPVFLWFIISNVLLARPPADLLQDLSETEPLPVTPPEVPVGLPSDLLRRRPPLRVERRWDPLSEEEEDEEDRILQKIHDEGLDSLSVGETIDRKSVV